MMHPFLTMDDETEIVHSAILSDERVKVYIEKPDAKDGFHHAVCCLPGYQWEDVFGFNSSKLVRYQGILESSVHLILQFSKEGEFENSDG